MGQTAHSSSQSFVLGRYGVIGMACARWLLALFLVACNTTREDAASADGGRAAAPKPSLARASASQQPSAAPSSPAAAASSVKTRGVLGERLEGDVYFFEAIAAKQCGPPPAAPAPKAPIVIGVELELTAKQPLNVSPRDLRLSSGGMIFRASDGKRRLAGCEPLLEPRGLQSGKTAKGYVMFDVPPPEPPNLELTYTPTRWGGASSVVTKLERCISCQQAAAP